jgi:hypothetical protein
MGGRGTSGAAGHTAAAGAYSDLSDAAAAAMHAAFYPQLSPAEAAAFRGYGHNDYVKINRLLRTGRAKEDSWFSGGAYAEAITKTFIHPMDTAFTRASRIPHATILHRGFSSHELEQALKNPHAKGMVFSDKGFVSTSRRWASAFSGRIHLRIHVPAGTKAVAMEHFGYGFEKEILLNRGSRFKVMGVKTTLFGKIMADVQLLPPERQRKKKSS